MEARIPERRAGPAARAGRRRTGILSARLGAALREARLGSGLTQRAAAEKVGLTQSTVSDAELGRGSRIPLETWALLAAAVGTELAAFLQAVPGADRPRDHEHLRRQEALIAFAAPGGWRAAPELAVDATPRSRSIDVALTRPETREAVVVEIWDWFDDVGAGLRGLDGKIAALAARLGDGWTVRGLYIVRATRRNRALVGEFWRLFAARFPGSGHAWIRALTDAAARLPREDALLWSSADATRMTPSRLGVGRRRVSRTR